MRSIFIRTRIDICKLFRWNILMGIENDIQKLFSKVVDKYNGNKAAAAESLGVNPVTFWGWVTGKRSLNPVLCGAIDKAGGILLVPGASPPDHTPPNAAQDIQALTKQIVELEKQIEYLKVYKNKWEGHIETIRAQNGADSLVTREKNQCA